MNCYFNTSSLLPWLQTCYYQSLCSPSKSIAISLSMNVLNIYVTYPFLYTPHCCLVFTSWWQSSHNLHLWSWWSHLDVNTRYELGVKRKSVTRTVMGEATVLFTPVMPTPKNMFATKITKTNYNLWSQNKTILVQTCANFLTQILILLLLLLWVIIKGVKI